MSRRIIALALALLLVLSLFGCGKIRTPDNYYVGEYEGGWSVLYKDEEGNVEEIAAMGSYAQPLVLVKGRIYYMHDGALVSVDSNGEDHKRLPMKGTDSGFIAYIDENYLYCVKNNAASTCYKADLELTGCEEIPIPRNFRQTDYVALLKSIKTSVAAAEEQIRVRSAYITLDGNGSLVSMDLDVLTFRGWTGSMKVWSSGKVTVQMTTAAPVIQYTDLNVPLSLSDSTTDMVVPLDALITAAETADKAEIATKRGSGAEGFVLAYLQDDHDANIGSAPWMGVSGIDASADSAVPHFVLSQIGGTAPTLTDSHKNSCTVLGVLRFDL